MKTAIITGASGMIGGLVLQECLNSDYIGKVISITRRPIGIKHDKLKEIIHHDFNNYSSIAAHFENIDIAYFCIGVYTGAVSRDEFRTITVDYTKAFAEMFKNKSPNATFCFLSGAGADQKEKSRMMFAKDKGVAENFLINLQFSQLYIFRPAYIYPVTPRKEPNFSYKLSRKLYPLLKRIMPDGVIPSTTLAKAIFLTGLKGHKSMIIENKAIRRIVIPNDSQNFINK
ncbi:MAG: NAD-dependent epimerase/dehydratase family protein [Bacteroidales bacterium]|nr:NAD-dependent epimerase/dehydratase family protein [Bacteroidales bacterium]